MPPKLLGQIREFRRNLQRLSTDLRPGADQRAVQRGLPPGVFTRDAQHEPGSFDVFDQARIDERRRNMGMPDKRNRGGGGHNNGPPIGPGGYPNAPFGQPRFQLHTAPTPFAPLTASTVTEAWTDTVVDQFRRQADYAGRLSVSFLSQARWYKFWSNLTLFAVALSLAAGIVVVLLEPDERDWYGAIFAAIALFLVTIDKALTFAPAASRFENAGQQLRGVQQNIMAYLSKPFDTRADPYDLSVGVEGKISDIINQAYGRPVDFQSDPFTVNPYD